MSIQLKTGCIIKIPDNMDITTVLRCIKLDIRDFAIQRIQKGMARAFFEFATKISIAKNINDIQKAQNELLPFTTIDAQRNDIIENIINKPKVAMNDIFQLWISHYQTTLKIPYDFPEFDVLSKIYLFPHENKFYAVYSCPHIINMKLKKHALIEDFSYWDNDEKPETISDEDWKKRAEIWKTILPTNNLTEDGMIVEIIYENQNFGKRAIFNRAIVNKYIEIEYTNFIQTLTIDYCVNNKQLIETLMNTTISDEQFSKPNINELIKYNRIVQKAFDKKEPCVMEIYNNIKNITPKNYDECINIIKNKKETILKSF